MTARELEKLICSAGWYHTDTRGSHKYFKHSTIPGKITIPQHRGDVKKLVEKSILKQAGLL